MADPLLVACPHCNALNRVPAARLGEGPDCGKCHRRLFTGKPVLVDFWAPWSGTCRVMAPHFEQAAAQLEPGMRLAKVDTEAEPALGNRFGIRSIPTMALFAGGREVARQAGAMGVADIVRWATANLPRPGSGTNP